jgi:hypothetical protein
MDMILKQQFLDRWNEYFPGADLPITFCYTDLEGMGETAAAPTGHRCLIGDLGAVRQGRSLAFHADTITCSGGKRYLGFAPGLRPNFEYFLSYGIKGKLEGERYKKSPELVNEQMKHQTPFTAPAKYIVFKRFDRLEEIDEPIVVIFFATADVLSGLFTLANFDQSYPYGVVAPFGAGCATIVDYPLKEAQLDQPRAVLGMFDVSARPCAPAGALTFSVPWKKFMTMVSDMDESFLITESWRKVKNRIDRN